MDHSSIMSSRLGCRVWGQNTDTANAGEGFWVNDKMLTPLTLGKRGVEMLGLMANA